MSSFREAPGFLWQPGRCRALGLVTVGVSGFGEAPGVAQKRRRCPADSLRWEHVGLSFCKTVPFPPLGTRHCLFLAAGFSALRPCRLIRNQRQQPHVGLTSNARIGESA